MSGIIDLVNVDTLFNFTIRAILNSDFKHTHNHNGNHFGHDHGTFIDKEFNLTVTTTGNRPPLWNTPAGLIGEIFFGIPFSFQFSAGDPDNNPLVYTAIGLPPGFSLSPSGELTGTLTDPNEFLYSFSITVNDGFSFTARTFALNANDIVTFPVIWTTPTGSIGEIKEGDKSLLNVRAESDSIWLRYELTSGSLPVGLALDVNTGDIWGKANEQVNVDTTFDFTIRAFNEDIEEFQDFSLELLNAYEPGATKTHAALYGNDRLLWLELFTSDKIVISDIFRQGDAQYGLVKEPRILIVENLDNPTADEIFLAIQDVKKTFLTLGKVKVAKAVNNDEIVYEVLYRKIFDDSEGALLEFNVPQTSQLVKPGSLTNLRERLITELSSSGDEDNLPLYLTSQQIIGDDSTILGYTPLIPFAYVKPGVGQEIADKINETTAQKEKLYLRRVKIDRFIVTPSASNDFDPYFILFDE